MIRNIFIVFFSMTHLFAVNERDKICRQGIYRQYQEIQNSKQLLNPFKPHMHRLRVLCRQCPSVLHLGSIVTAATLSIFLGMTDVEMKDKQFLAVGRPCTNISELKKLNRWARDLKIKFNYIEKNTCLIEPLDADLLFVDSDHRYAHLSLELENMHQKISKYIFIHHTGSPWGLVDEQNYFIDDFAYPEWIDCSKRGLRAAVQDFLNRHPEWQKDEENANSHGFTILKRLK